MPFSNLMSSPINAALQFSLLVSQKHANHDFDNVNNS